MKHQPKHYVEYAFFRSVAFFMQVLPYRAALAVGWVIAWLGFFVFRFRVVAACERIREVMGDDLSDRDVRRIAWRGFRNTCFSAVDLIRVPKMTLAWVKKVTDYDDAMKFKKALSQKGGVLALPHMGSWDMGAVALSMFDVPIFIITRRQKNLLMDAYMNRMRQVTNIEIICRESGALKRIISNLKKGKVFAITPDVRAKEDALRVNFLGKEANLARGPVVFARHAKVPVYPGYIVRKGWTRQVWTLGDPVLPDLKADKREDAQRMMQELMDQFTVAVRAHPEHYFWYNKRWVLEPLREQATDSAT